VTEEQRPAPDDGSTPDGLDDQAAEPSSTTPAGPVARPGATTFTIEGRAAPALFVVGWLASLLGLGIVIVAMMSGGSVGGSLLFLVGLGVLAIGLVAGAGSQAIERRARGRTDYAGPSPVLGFLASVPLTILAVVLVLTPLAWAGLDVEGPGASLLGVFITAIVYVAVIRLLVVGTGALTWREMGIVRPSSAVVRELAWGAALAVPVLFGTGLLGALLAQFLEVPPDVLPPAFDGTGLLVNFVAAAVVAPIGEEIFFRGYVTTAWVRTVGAQRAIVWGSVLFAAAHILTVTATSASEGLEFALFAFAVRLPVALVLGWLFIRTRSIYGPIALHATYNGLQVLALAAASTA
jgi:membrane protease YdiL (CAAX protease family)